MKKEKVIHILLFCRDAEKRVRMNKRVIKNLEDRYYCSVASPRLDGLPGSKGGKSNPTEATALNIPPTVRKTIRELERDSQKTEAVAAEVLKEINLLPYAQKETIYGFYIQREKWDRISLRINYSVRQCKNIRGEALAKLGRRFNSNKAISNYRYPQN